MTSQHFFPRIRIKKHPPKVWSKWINERDKCETGNYKERKGCFSILETHQEHIPSGSFCTVVMWLSSIFSKPQQVALDLGTWQTATKWLGKRHRSLTWHQLFFCVFTHLCRLPFGLLLYSVIYNLQTPSLLVISVGDNNNHNKS